MTKKTQLEYWNEMLEKYSSENETLEEWNVS